MPGRFSYAAATHISATPQGCGSLAPNARYTSKDTGTIFCSYRWSPARRGK
jgi:hypothetical protein